MQQFNDQQIKDIRTLLKRAYPEIETSDIITALKYNETAEEVIKELITTIKTVKFLDFEVAAKYLMQNDPSFKISLNTAIAKGYRIEDLSSIDLAEIYYEKDIGFKLIQLIPMLDAMLETFIFGNLADYLVSKELNN